MQMKLVDDTEPLEQDTNNKIEDTPRAHTQIMFLKPTQLPFAAKGF